MNQDKNVPGWFGVAALSFWGVLLMEKKVDAAGRFSF